MNDTVDIVFDTECVLCSRMVAFVLAYERAPVVRQAGQAGSTA